MGNKAIIYARVSTLAQEDNESLKYQILKGQEYCNFKNFVIYKTISDVESGSKDDRKGYQELLKEIKNRNFDFLVVYETSRVSRTALTLHKFIDELHKNKIKFISISQPELDTTSTTGMFNYQILASVAEMERKQTGIRTKSNKLARAKDGNWQGGNLPLGYMKNSKNEIIIDPINSKIVVNIFNDYFCFQSVKKVAEKYKRNKHTISYILKNQFYIGKIPYGKQENDVNTGITTKNKNFKYFFDGRHEPIIEIDVFNNIQNIMKSRKPKRAASLLFSSLLTCECGGKMHKIVSHKYCNYKCSKCRKSVSKLKIEPIVINKLISMTELNKLNKRTSMDTIIDLQKKINNINAEISKTDDEKNKLLSLLRKGIITEREYINNKKDLENEIETENEKIGRYQSLIEFENKKDNQKDNIQILKSVIEHIDNEDIEQVNEVLRMLIKFIRIKNFNNYELEIILNI